MELRPAQLAEAVAPGIHRMIGIRPGEKLHEVGSDGFTVSSATIP